MGNYGDGHYLDYTLFQCCGAFFSYFFIKPYTFKKKCIHLKINAYDKDKKSFLWQYHFFFFFFFFFGGGDGHYTYI